MEPSEILTILNGNYPIHFDTLEFLREAGNISYAAYAGGHKYFLRVIKPLFSGTIMSSLDIHLFLQSKSFPVPPVVFAKGGAPCVRKCGRDKNYCCVLYEFIAGKEADPEEDAEAVGALVGEFHRLMDAYTGPLAERDEAYYYGRYIDLLRRKHYPKADEFAAYGADLWNRVKSLPRGCCHGDLYSGNTHKSAKDGKIYLLDFDTSGRGFPFYDIVLYCNRTDYFAFQEDGYERSRRVLNRFLPEYRKRRSLEQEEIDAFFDLNALYHFALQAIVIENYGLDCVDNAFLDQQLDWLYRWREQCRQNRTI